MHHESSDRSWLVLDECDDERSDIEKRFSETSLNQSKKRLYVSYDKFVSCF